MTKDNYTQLSNLEIIEIIDGLGIGTMGLLRYLKNRNPELVQEIVQRTHGIAIQQTSLLGGNAIVFKAGPMKSPSSFQTGDCTD